MKRLYIFGRKTQITTLLIPLFIILILAACVSHLREAKLYYSRGQRQARSLDQKKAISSFKKALQEARFESEKNPSAQAYMIKGLAELELELWQEAEESFRQAFSYGFDKGEEWAKQLSLLGLASSLSESGLEDAALKIYLYLIEKSKLEKILFVASQRYTDMALKRAMQEEADEKQRSLAHLLKTIQKLARRDISNGFYHYLLSQTHSHLSDYKQSFEEAVIARELGLPTERIFRDNDLQIVLCYRLLKERLSSEEWERFKSSYHRWIKRWDWKGPEFPDWKKR